MKTKRFTVEIEMGDAAMTTSLDLAQALLGVARQLRDETPEIPRPVHSRTIRDENGNTVGTWNIAEGRS